VSIETTAVTLRQVRAGQAVLVLFSLFWAFFPGFGLIDLITAEPPGDPEFRKHWFREGSWGTLVTSLIIAPLLATALRPGLASNAARHQMVLAGCFVMAAALCLDGQFLLLPIGLALSTGTWWALMRPASQSAWQVRPLWWPLLLIGAGYLVLPGLAFGADAFTPHTVGTLAGVVALAGWLAHASPTSRGHLMSPGRRWILLLPVVVAALPWLGYSLEAASAARGDDYTGSGIDRLVAQAAFPTCVLVPPAVASFGWLPVRLAVWPAAVAGAGFGLLGVGYPEHLSSPGAGWGVAAAVWSTCLVILAESIVRSDARASPAARPGRAAP
jgi:hypothetical protein